MMARKVGTTPVRTLRAPDDEWEAAQAAAAARGESVTDVIRAALRAYVEDYERELAEIAAARGRRPAKRA